jgi:predicted acylesterase/phospholipase RssA
MAEQSLEAGAKESGSPLRRSRRSVAALLSSIVGVFLLLGCAPAVMKGPPRTEQNVPAWSMGTVRTLGSDHWFVEVPEQRVAQHLRDLGSTGPLNILALSGGGADGAFGAGALVGMTRAGTRPRFSVVTGVSAGALIAPYAFVGQAWDPQLMDAYTGGRAEHLLQPRGLAALFGSSVYQGAPLQHLVDHYLTDALLQAMAREAATGRLLLVATTNVDSGETVVWDLGAIAMNGGRDAKELIRNILVASASVPGLFPPVLIRVQEVGAAYEEAHVDGTTTAPFLVPSAFLNQGSLHTNVYVIVNGRLNEKPLSLHLSVRPILSRSISTGLTHMLRMTLALTASDVQLQGASLRYSAIPLAYPDLAPFDFHAATMRSLFQYGYECASTGRLWVSEQHVASSEQAPHDPGAGQSIQCPAEDGYMSLFASR